MDTAFFRAYLSHNFEYCVAMRLQSEVGILRILRIQKTHHFPFIIYTLSKSRLFLATREKSKLFLHFNFFTRSCPFISHRTKVFSGKWEISKLFLLFVFGWRWGSFSRQKPIPPPGQNTSEHLQASIGGKNPQRFLFYFLTTTTTTTITTTTTTTTTKTKKKHPD